MKISTFYLVSAWFNLNEKNALNNNIKTKVIYIIYALYIFILLFLFLKCKSNKSKGVTGILKKIFKDKT